MTKKASLDTVLARWSTLIANLHVSPMAFYQSVEAALQRRAIPETQNSRVDYLQELIKGWADAHDWRAVIERPILDGLGSVDVALEKGD